MSEDTNSYRIQQLEKRCKRLKKRLKAQKADLKCVRKKAQRDYGNLLGWFGDLREEFKELETLPLSVKVLRDDVDALFALRPKVVHGSGVLGQQFQESGALGSLHADVPVTVGHGDPENFGFGGVDVEVANPIPGNPDRDGTIFVGGGSVGDGEDRREGHDADASVDVAEGQARAFPATDAEMALVQVVRGDLGRAFGSSARNWDFINALHLVTGYLVTHGDLERQG